MSASKYQIRIDVTEEEKKAIEEWKKLMGFRSQKEMVRFLTLIGSMAIEQFSEGPLTGEQLANALYTVVASFIRAEFGSNVNATIKNFKEWQEWKKRQTVSYSPIRPLTQT